MLLVCPLSLALFYFSVSTRRIPSGSIWTPTVIHRSNEMTAKWWWEEDSVEIVSVHHIYNNKEAQQNPGTERDYYKV